MRKIAILLGLSMLAMLGACGGQDGAEPAAEDTAPEITITNGLEDYDIYYIQIDPSDSPWGDDRLGEDEILEPGESFTLEITEGTWDIMVTDEDLDTYTLWLVDIGPEGYEWNVTLDDMDSGWEEEEYLEPILIETGEGDAPVVITNNIGGYVIYFVYVSLSEEAWGDDLLGMEILDQDDVITVWVDPGLYDIQVEDEDGDTYTLWEVEVGIDGYYWSVTLDDMD